MTIDSLSSCCVIHAVPSTLHQIKSRLHFHQMNEEVARYGVRVTGICEVCVTDKENGSTGDTDKQ